MSVGGEDAQQRNFSVGTLSFALTSYIDFGQVFPLSEAAQNNAVHFTETRY